MDYNIKEVADRLKGLRMSCDMSVEELCEKTDMNPSDYMLIESGDKDFSVTFLYKCAELFDVELVEILTGVAPKLSKCSIIKSGKGLPIERRERFAYQHMAYLFKDKSIEPLLVKAPFDPAEQDKPIKLSVHDGQEFDYILKGSLKFVCGDHTEVVSAGDAMYYDSTTPHGMIATDGDDCEFLAVLIKK